MFSFFATAPTSPHPQIHIKEANGHLEALFEEKIKLEKEVDDLRLVIVQKDERERELLDAQEVIKNEYEEKLSSLEKEKLTILVELTDLKRKISVSEEEVSDGVLCETQVENVEQELADGAIDLTKPSELVTDEIKEKGIEDEAETEKEVDASVPDPESEAPAPELDSDSTVAPEVDAETAETAITSETVSETETETVSPPDAICETEGDAVSAAVPEAESEVTPEAEPEPAVPAETETVTEVEAEPETVVDPETKAEEAPATEDEAVPEISSVAVEEVTDIVPETKTEEAPAAADEVPAEAVPDEAEAEAVAAEAEAVPAEAEAVPAEAEAVPAVTAEAEAVPAVTAEAEAVPAVTAEAEAEAEAEAVPETKPEEAPAAETEAVAEASVADVVSPVTPDSLDLDSTKETSQRTITVTAQLLQTSDIPTPGGAVLSTSPDTENDMHLMCEQTIKEQQQQLEELRQKASLLEELLNYKSAVQALSLCMEKADEIKTLSAEIVEENKTEIDSVPNLGTETHNVI